MSQFRNLTEYNEAHVVATSSTEQFEWLTGWMPTEGVDNIRAVLKAKNATGSGFQWRLAIQYAAVRADNPGTPATFSGAGQTQAGNGEYETGDISVSAQQEMPGNRLFRLGIAYASPSGGVQQADVSLVASWKSVGTHLGAARVTLSAVDTGTKYEPLTGWVPATFMSKVRAVFVMTGITGASNNFRYRFAFQTAGPSVQDPSGWNDLESFVTPSTANTERNTGEISLSTTAMWFRLGVGYGMTTGVDTNVTAVLDAFLSCR